MQQVERINVESILSRHGIATAVKGGNPVETFLTWLLPGLEEGGSNLILGGPDSRVLISLARESFPVADTLGWQVGGMAGGRCGTGHWPRSAAWVVSVLSYDDLATAAGRETRGSASWAVNAGLVIDRTRRCVEWRSSRPDLSFQFGLSQIDLAIDRARSICPSGDWLSIVGATQNSVGFCTLDTDRDYLDNVEQVLHLIRNGQFYQLNLLRFFAMSGQLPAGWGTTRMMRAGGSYSALIDLDPINAISGQSDVQRILSFSPEKFLSVQAGSRVIETWPVKGTAPRGLNALEDEGNARQLLASEKNLAELHMIVDLMRNDFHRICDPGSVTVPIAHALRSHANVHHLHAKVSGIMKSDTTLGDIIAAVCPAGSITGAPKVEVMKWIRKLEGRPRGFHMGNIFLLEPDGAFDSSVMIRSLIRHRKINNDQPCYDRYDLAVGSGIVVHSDPQSELEEIAAKSTVVLADLQKLYRGDPS